MINVQRFTAIQHDQTHIKSARRIEGKCDTATRQENESMDENKEEKKYTGIKNSVGANAFHNIREQRQQIRKYSICIYLCEA